MLGNQIHELRRKKKIQQDEIAKIMGISKSLVSAWERDQRHPSLEQIAHLEEILGGPLHLVHPGNEGIYIPIRGKVWATPFKMSAATNALKTVKAQPGESNCFALEVEGDSMTPVYNHGDTIICRPKLIELTPFVADEEGAYVPKDNTYRTQ